ncbi:MAG: B12-binding domain-containing protein [Prolixibacteraceae bacterium]
MEELFNQIATCVEFGKINKTAPYPPNMRDQDGVDELTKLALIQGASAQEILSEALIKGMGKVGVKFRENKVFVPQVLMSAKAMAISMLHLKPYFASGEIKHKGTFIIGTVEGDLHDIGKNLVSMMVEGNGFKVIDLGTDVKAEMFIEAASQNPGSILGLSALLTTTMANMEKIVVQLKSSLPEMKICIGGAPVNQSFCEQIKADFYSRDPQGVVDYLNKIAG